MIILGTPAIDFGIPDWIIPAILVLIYAIYYTVRKIQARAKLRSSSSNYPEINRLAEMYRSHAISIEPGDLNKDSMSLLHFQVEDNSYEIYVQDEFEDLKLNKQLLDLALVLKELELYKDSDDFLEWCKWQGLNASSDFWRNYYTNLDSTYTKVLDKLGTIECPINSMDFELNAGAAQELRLH